jgi:hypothetical protein
MFPKANFDEVVWSCRSSSEKSANSSSRSVVSGDIGIMMSKERESSVSPRPLKLADSLDGVGGELHIYGSVQALEVL